MHVVLCHECPTGFLKIPTAVRAVTQLHRWSAAALV